MSRIYVNFHTTLRKVGSVLTGDYCSTYSKIVKEVRLTFQVSSTSFLHSNYWLNFFIRDLIAPSFRSNILHNSSIVFPIA